MATVKSIIESNRSSGGGSLSYPSEMGKYGMLFMFAKYDYSQTRQVLTKPPSPELSGQSVTLPLPQGGLAEKTTIDLAETDLTVLGALIAQGASNPGSGEGILGSGFNPEDIDGTAAMKIGLAAATGAAGAGGSFGSFIGGAAASTAFGVGTGTAFNKYTALAFNNVGLRSHSFSWSFTPKNASETETISNIRMAFQRAAHPTYASLGTDTGGVLGRVVMNYPQLVYPYILIDAAEKYYYSFKPCLISDVSFAYKSESGMAFIKGGKPARIEMTLNLKETSIWTAEDYGGAGGSTFDPSLGTGMTATSSSPVNAAVNSSTAAGSASSAGGSRTASNAPPPFNRSTTGPQ